MDITITGGAVAHFSRAADGTLERLTLTLPDELVGQSGAEPANLITLRWSHPAQNSGHATVHVHAGGSLSALAFLR